MTLLLPLLAFLFASLLIAAGAMALSPAEGTIERRLGEVLTGDHVKPLDAERPYSRAVIDTLKKIGRAAPQSPSEMGKLQRKLTTAGYRSYEAVAVFYGIRLGCALIAFALLATPIIVHPNIALALAGCSDSARTKNQLVTLPSASPATSVVSPNISASDVIGVLSREGGATS